MTQIVKRYAAYMLVGLGLVGYGLGCETQEAQKEADAPVVERPEQEERGQPREGQSEQARQQQKGDELPGLADQEIGQRDQQKGGQRGTVRQQQPREQERPQGRQENLEGQTRRGGAPGEIGEAGERVGQAAQRTQGSQARRVQVNPDWLGYYTSDGRAVTAEQVVGVDGNRVELEFEAGQAGQTQQAAQPQEGAQTGGLRGAVRWFAHRGAVMDRQGERRVITSTGETTEVQQRDRQQSGQ